MAFKMNNEDESIKTTNNELESDDEDVPKLSSNTLAALEEFYAEKLDKENENQRGNRDTEIDENWQLSQFWYDDETAQKLADETLRIAGVNGCIACLCCPTVFKKLASNTSKTCVSNLFEYDDRFSIYGDNFIHYDYKQPLSLNPDLKQKFDVIIADPPFLSRECLTKIAETIKFLSKDKIILCTGAVMEDLVEEILSLHRCQFEPKHARALGNPFYCYSNYNLDDHVNSTQ